MKNLYFSFFFLASVVSTCSAENFTIESEENAIVEIDYREFSTDQNGRIAVLTAHIMGKKAYVHELPGVEYVQILRITTKIKKGTFTVAPFLEESNAVKLELPLTVSIDSNGTATIKKNKRAKAAVYQASRKKTRR